MPGRGYMAPEYAVLGQLSVKLDVYSLGVLILEIVTRALFSSLQNSKFFHSLSITSIFSRLHGVLNVGKKN